VIMATMRSRERPKPPADGGVTGAYALQMFEEKAAMRRRARRGLQHRDPLGRTSFKPGSRLALAPRIRIIQMPSRLTKSAGSTA
jgi:hypothetical protein